jgi:hypothetical protein
MGPYAGVDYNVTLCPLQGRLQHIYNGQPLARVDLTLCQSRLYPPVRDFWIWPLNMFIVYSSHATLSFSPPPTKEGNILPQATLLAHMLYSYI